MKFQLIILTIFVVGALTHPVPDEEVSPGIKSDKVQMGSKDSIKSNAIKPEVRSVVSEDDHHEQHDHADHHADEHHDHQHHHTKALDKQQKSELPAAAPDAVLLAQKLPEKKEELSAEKKKVDKKEEKKAEQKPLEKKSEQQQLEKQTRSDELVVEEAKALPVVAGLTPTGEHHQHQHLQQVADDGVKHVVDEQHFAGKTASFVSSPAVPSEQKRDELTVAESQAEIKAERPADVATPLIAEEKPEESSIRQERTAEEKPAGSESVPEPEVAASEHVTTEVKSLKSEEQTAHVGEHKHESGDAVSHAPKSLESAEKKEQEQSAETLKQQAPALQSEPLSEQKDLKHDQAKQVEKREDVVPEVKKLEEAASAVVPAVAPVEQVSTVVASKSSTEGESHAESHQATKALTEKLGGQDDKITESIKVNEDSSKESEESKESDESKEDKKN